MPTLEELQSKLDAVSGVQAQQFVNPTPDLGQPAMDAPVQPLDMDTTNTGVRQIPGVTPGPTPQAQPLEVDPLETKLKEAEAAIKEGGTFTVPTKDPELGATQNFLRAFNQKFAQTIGLPEDIAHSVLTLIGINAFGSRGEGGSSARPGTAAAKEALAKLGINTDAIDGLSKELGEATFSSLAMYGGMLAAAPSMAAKTGTGVVDTTLRVLGEALKKHPWLGLVEEGGATVGSVLGEGATKGTAMEPVASLGGGIAGAVTTGGIARRIAGTGNRIAGLWNRGNTPGGPTTGIRDTNVDISGLPQYADDQIKGDIKTMQDAIDNVIASVPANLSAKDAQVRLRKGMERAEDLGREVESTFWERVPLKEPVPMQGIRKNLEQMQADLTASNRFGKNVPNDEIEELKNIGRPARDPDTGRMYKDLPTVEQLRNKSREYKVAARKEDASEAPDAQRVAYLNRLSAIIDEGISAALPSDVSIKQAREFSIKFNDMFSRGPIADVLRSRRSGAEFVPPGQTTEALLKKFEGVESVTNMTRELGSVRNPNDRRRFGLTRPARDEIAAVQTQMEDSIRSMFRESVGDPAEASKFVAKFEDQIKSLAGTSAQLKRVVDTTTALAADQAEVAKSALAKFSQRSPEKAIAGIWGAPDPLKMAKEIRGGLSSSQEAVKGLSNGMIDELWRRGGGTVGGVANVMNDNTIRKVLEATVDPGALQRLDRIVAVAQRLEAGEGKTMRQTLAPGASVLFRVIGAHIGRSIAPGQLQAPSIMAQNALRLAENIFGMANPGDTLRRAILDPNLERALLKRMPTNSREMKVLARSIGGATGAKEIGREIISDATE